MLLFQHNSEREFTGEHFLLIEPSYSLSENAVYKSRS